MQTKRMITKIAFLFVLFNISKSEIICPKQSWTPFKMSQKKNLGRFRYQFPQGLVQFFSLPYRCPINDVIELSAIQEFQNSRQDILHKINEQNSKFTTSIKTCKLDCNNVSNIIDFCNLQ